MENSSNMNEKLTEDEKFVVVKAAEAIQNDDNKFKLTSRAALMQVHNLHSLFMNSFYDVSENCLKWERGRVEFNAKHKAEIFLIDKRKHVWKTSITFLSVKTFQKMLKKVRRK